MPYRAYHLVLGIAGVAAVVLLVMVGANVEAQSRSGPRWKQRVLAAGILLLAALGVGPACSKGGAQKTTSASAMTAGDSTTRDSTTPAVRPTVTPPVIARPGAVPPKAAGHYTDLARSAEWVQISKVTAQAEVIAAGQKGSYPFDRAGRKRLLGALQTAQFNAYALAKRKLITAGEAGLLKQDLQTLEIKVAAFRPTEMRASSCYSPQPMIPPTTHSLKRLRTRLPLLRKLAAAKGLHPRVLRKVLARVEADVAILEDPAKRGQLKKSDRADAKKLAVTARAQLAKIKVLLKRATRQKGK